MATKKKILHIIQSLNRGGCENMLLRTLPLLTTFEHKIITLKEAGELAQRFKQSGLPTENVSCRTLFDVFGIVRLRKIVRSEQPDIIVTYLFHADMIGRLTLSGTTNAPIIPFLRTTYNHPKYLIARILEWITKPLVNKYLANSEAVKEFYINHIGVESEKITVIPNGIDLVHFDSMTPDPELRKSLGITPDDFIIICVANLHINKGHRYLLEAFESFFPDHPHTTLLLVGDGIERKNLEKQINRYQSKNNILFLGKRSDVPQLLKVSHLFVLPTLFEGQSNAILEAMASKLPIITTDIPENRALLTDNFNSILVPVRHSSVIVEALLQLEGNESLRKQISSEARMIIEHSFRLEKIAKRWETSLSERP
jgi:glycosyltransferase involved in cell wall biosynthesis